MATYMHSFASNNSWAHNQTTNFRFLSTDFRFRSTVMAVLHRKLNNGPVDTIEWAIIRFRQFHGNLIKGMASGEIAFTINIFS